MGVEEMGRGEKGPKSTAHHYFALLFSGEWHDGWRDRNGVDALRTVTCWGWRWHSVLSSSIPSSELTVFWDFVKEENESFRVSLGSQIFMTPLTNRSAHLTLWSHRSRSSGRSAEAEGHTQGQQPRVPWAVLRRICLCTPSLMFSWIIFLKSIHFQMTWNSQLFSREYW